MTKEDKIKIVNELADKISATPYFYITDTSALTANETTKFRRLCFEKGIEYVVYKNSLIKKALERQEGVDYSPFHKTVLKGSSGILFNTSEQGSLPALLLQDYLKKNQKSKLAFKGASIDKSLFIGENTLADLAKIKSKNELIGDVIGMLQSPAKNVISALQSGGSKLAGILQTLSEKGE